MFQHTQQRLTDDDKDKFYNDLIFLFSELVKMSWSWLVDLNKHFGKDVSGYDGIHGGLGYGIRNLERVRILEEASFLNMTVCNTFFKNRDSQLRTYTFGLFKTQMIA